MQYHGLESNLSELDGFSRSKKAKVLQSLIALAKLLEGLLKRRLFLVV